MIEVSGLSREEREELFLNTSEKLTFRLLLLKKIFGCVTCLITYLIGSHGRIT